MMVKSVLLRPGRNIVIRNGQGRVTGCLPIKTVETHPEGCARHVHVQLEDKRRWCYDEGAIVEMS